MVAAYFLDTSALLKRYVPEIGTQWMQSIADPQNEHLLIIAQITWVEFHSAIARRQREHSVSADQAQQILAAFNFHWNEQYFTVPSDFPVMQLAAQLVQQHPLRAYDAVQLAAALSIQNQLAAPDISSFTFLTADDRLCNVSQLAGLLTDNPNRHP
jgi:uncharacterized protein